MTLIGNLNSTNTSVAHEIANITNIISEGTDLDLRDDFVSEWNGDSDDILESDDDKSISIRDFRAKEQFNGGKHNKK